MNITSRNKQLTEIDKTHQAIQKEIWDLKSKGTTGSEVKDENDENGDNDDNDNDNDNGNDKEKDNSNTTNTSNPTNAQSDGTNTNNDTNINSNTNSNTSYQHFVTSVPQCCVRPNAS